MALQTIENQEQVKQIAAYFSQKRIKKIVIRRDVRDNYEIDFYTGRDTASTLMLFEYDRIYLAQNFGLKLWHLSKINPPKRKK